MAIRTIEIICLPCPKCEKLNTNILQAIKAIELTFKIKIPYELKHTPHLRDISKYSVSPSQTPAVIINGKLEFAGNVEPALIQKKLESIHRY